LEEELRREVFIKLMQFQTVPLLARDVEEKGMCRIIVPVRMKHAMPFNIIGRLVLIPILLMSTPI